MKKMFLLLLLASLPLAAQTVTDPSLVADDAVVIDRVAELTGKEFPVSLFKRIVKDDIEALRGARADGTYAYARLERFEGGRKDDTFSIHSKGDRFTTVSLSGENTYRVQLDSPKRKLLVTKNRPVYVERIEVELTGQRGAVLQNTVIPVNAVITPGEVRVVDLPQIVRQATVKVVARAESEGYGNLEVSLLEARIVDDPSSPWADAVASLKAIQRAIDQRDITSMRAMASRLRRSLSGPAAVVTAIPTVATPGVDTQALESELRVIESMMRGDETDRRRAAERLQEVIRRLR